MQQQILFEPFAKQMELINAAFDSNTTKINYGGAIR